MAHRWLSNDVSPDDLIDVSKTCYACGVTVDCPETAEDHVSWLIPDCEPGNPERAHHFVYELVSNGAERVIESGIETAGPIWSDGLVCAYGDCTITEDTEGAAVSPCVGG